MYPVGILFGFGTLPFLTHLSDTTLTNGQDSTLHHP
jgi:hypothetical protein